MNPAVTFRDAMGALAVVITLAAYGIYVWQTLRGEARPHPLSWPIFGILTGTAYTIPNSLRLLHVPDMLLHSRGASASEFCQSQVHEKPFARKATRVPNGAPGGAGVVGHATRTDVATRPRFGRGARHRRSACANRLLRARCASRRSTTIAVLRRGCRPALREFRSRSAGGRLRQPASSR